MTCVSALVKNGVGYMASDSCASQGSHEKTVKNPKVLNINGILLGICGAWRCINIISNSLITDDFELGHSTHKFAFKLCNRLMDLMEDFKATSKEDGSIEMDAELLIIYGKDIIKIGSDFCYIIFKDNYAAIGSGSDHAEGILSGTAYTPENLVKKSIKSSAKHNAGVDAEVVLITNG